MSVIYALSEFTDDRGTDWKVQIVDSSISTGNLNYPFNLGPDGFRLEYGYDNFDRAIPILGSKLSFTLFEPLTWRPQFEALFTYLDTAVEGTYRVEVYRSGGGLWHPFWIGEILPEQTIIPDEYDNPAVLITAVDGLGNLKGIDYNNAGAPYEGTDKITAHLFKAINKVHSSNFWGAGDVQIKFFEDFIGAQYQALIGSGQNKQLDNAKIEHITFYNPDSNGVNQYYSAYEVLESIATTLNASIFMAEGTYWLVPLGAIQSAVLQSTLSVYNTISGSGVVVYNTSTNLSPLTTFESTQSNVDYVKAKGWERSSTPAFKEVTRTRNYQGDVPVLSTAYYNMPRIANSSGQGALLADEDALQPEAREYVLSGTFQFGTIGISSLTGQDGVVRARLKFLVRVGDAGGTDRYINRGATFSSAATSNVVWYGQTASQGWPGREPQYTDTTWSAAPSSRLEWYSEFFNGANGNSSYPNNSQFYHGENFSLTLPGIPAWASGVNVSVALEFVDWNGVPITTVDFLSPTQNYSSWKITSLGLNVLDDNEIEQFGEYDIHAINPDTARYKFDQGTTLIGDKIGAASLGTILIDEGTSGAGQGYVNATYWQNSQETSATNYSINGLGVRERLGANKNARRTERGTLIRRKAQFIHPYTILLNVYDAFNFYQLTGLSFIASRSEYDVEVIYLSRNINGITEAIDGRRPSKGDRPVIIGPYDPVTTKGPVDNTITDNNTTKLGFISTDSYGITKVIKSTGTSSVDIYLPDSKASLGQNVITINDLGVMAPVGDGAIGTYLKTDGSGGLTWAAAGGGGGGGGWFGSTTTIKVMPSEFIMNDDSPTNPPLIQDSLNSYLGIKAGTSISELYAFIPIPDLYKVTHGVVYTSKGGTNLVNISEYNHKTGAKTVGTTGNFNTNINVTDIPTGPFANAVIKVSPASSKTLIYGADLTIALI